jgi:hypothetical protein
MVLLISTVLLCHAASGQSWIQLSPAGTPPSARGMNGSPGAYDSTNDRMILFGGQDSSGNNLNDVWVLQNATRVGGRPQWVNLIPNDAAGSPPARSGHSTAYDSANNRLIVFGGCSASCAPVLNDVWVLTNANGLGGTPVWTEVSPGGGPAPRTNSAATYDPVQNQLIVVGGQDGSSNPCSTFSDTWYLINANGLGTSSWQMQNLLGPVPGANGASVVLDPTTGFLTLFGGTGLVNGVCTVTNTVSILQVGSWAPVIAEGAAGSPPARSFQSAVYDTVGGRMLIFGGVDVSGNYLNDVWSLSNASGFASAWSKLSPTGGPPPARSGQAAVFDPASRRMTIFGGSGANGAVDDTWLLSAPGISEMICVFQPFIVPFVRAEGMAEQIGDLQLYCSGGRPTPPGESIPDYWITLSLNTNVTSRLLPEAVGLSEALLFIDQPFPATPVPSYASPVPGSPPQILCTPLGSTCGETGTGGTPSPYQTQPNVFVGKQSNATTVYWKVPIDPPGVNLTRTIRLANVRANVSQLGLPVGWVQATVGIQGLLQSPPVLNPMQRVAQSSQGVVASVVASASIPQCEPHNAVLLGGSGSASFDFSILVQAGGLFAFDDNYDVFTYRNYGTALYGPEYPQALSEQNVLNFGYGTETGFYSPSLFTTAPTLGLADFGTRFLVSLGSISAGTKLFVPTTITSGTGTPPLQLQLIQAESNGASAPGYEPIASTAMVGTTPVAEASRSGSTAYAVYEVVANPFLVGSFTIPAAVAFTNKPSTGAIMATTSLAPLGTIGFADQSSSIPRFANFATAQAAYSIVSCPAP